MKTHNLILESCLLLGLLIANISLIKIFIISRLDFKQEENNASGWHIIALLYSSTLLLTSCFQPIKDQFLNLVVFSDLTQSQISLKILSVVSIYFVLSFMLFVICYSLAKASVKILIEQKNEKFTQEFRLLVFIGLLIAFTMVAREIIQIVISNTMVNEFRIN
jgi:hypothetical protein